MLKIFGVLLITVLLLTIFLFNVSNINAQSCGSGCTSNYQCQLLCGDSKYGCFSQYPGTSCCFCVNGLLSGARGPFECANGFTDDNAPGCRPDPTSPPQPTSIPSPTPIVCCYGDDASCKYKLTYESCIQDPDLGCIWDSKNYPVDCPKPAAKTFVCVRPGSVDPDNKCIEYDQDCPNPDIPGALCYSSPGLCQTNCIPASQIQITIRPELNILTPCAKKGLINSLDTAIGCFPASDRNQMLAFILRWSLGVGGGLSFLLIVYAGFLIMASGANAEKVKAGRELLTAAITGLLLIIFSVFILDFFGIRLLQIPGL